MTGFCAMIRMAGPPVAPEPLHAMLAAMATPDTTDVGWIVTDAAGLGQRHRNFEASAPATGRLEQAHGLIIAADCRLDNRDVLIDALGMPPGVGDSALLLAGYRRWGRELASRLLGDFAFAIWNAETRQLYAARDHFGIKPFYYICHSAYFICASNLTACFASGFAERRFRPEAIGAFLSGAPPLEDSTSYADIWRLPPGHICIAAPGKFEISAYWRLQPPSETPRRGNAPEAFHALLSTATAARLRGTGLGAMLSGGLDSSSIACLAAGMPRAEPHAFPVFSMVFDATPERNERPFIEAALARGGLAPCFIPSDDVPPFANLETLVDEQQDLFLAPNMACTRRVYHIAHANGIRVLLDGHGGDEVAPVGGGRLSELAISGQWLGLWRQLSQNLLQQEENRLAAYWSFLKHFTQLRRLHRVPLARRLMRLGAIPPPLDFVRPDFAARIGLKERLRQTRHPLAARTERWRHYETLTSPLQSYAFEVLYRTAAAAGTEARYPFWDKRLVEFCLSLEPSEKLDQGWGRLILRRGMAGVLPPEIQWRSDKFNFLWHLATAMQRHHAAMITELLKDREGRLGAYIDLPRLRAAYAPQGGNAVEPNGWLVQWILRVAVLACWLPRQAGEVTG